MLAAEVTQTEPASRKPAMRASVYGVSGMRALVTMMVIPLMLVSSVSDADDFRSDLAAIDTAARQQDVAELEIWRARLGSTTPDYRSAYLAYSLAVANMERDAAAAKADLDQGIDVLEALVEIDPSSVEGWALLANCYGLKIGLSPLMAAFVGPKAGDAMEEAIGLAPDNPRVALVKGIALYQTPRIFGGDREAAIEWLSRAIEAYGVSPGGDIAWGYPDAYVWRALGYYHFEDTGRALADLDAALAIAPDHVWALSLREQMTASHGAQEQNLG